MDLTIFTDADLHDLSAQIAAEWERRRSKAQTDQAVTEVVTSLQAEGKIPTPEAGTDAATAKPWANPGTLHDKMYRQGDVVTHGGKTWISRHPFLNLWEPGAQGVDWRIWQEIDATPPVIGEETGEPEIIAWGVGQDVQPGDLRTHDGQTWECILAHTTHEGWAPSPAAHAAWKPAN